MATPEFASRSNVEEFPTVWQRVVTDPHGFFADMPETGGLGQPLVFLAICAGINALGHLLFVVGIGGMIGIFVWQIVAAITAAALFVLIAQNLFAGRAGFEPTFRVVAYAWAPLVIGWVPVVGRLAVLYTAYLLIRGLERVQAIDTARTVLTVVLTGIALAILHVISVGPHF